MEEFIVPLAGFALLMLIICGLLILIMRWSFISNTEGALKRLQEDIEKTNQRQADLSKKLKEADLELEKRRTEAKELADKMKTDAEDESKKEREGIIAKARTEGEEIITKAQTATEKMKFELEKEMDIRGVDFGLKLLNDVLSTKAKGALNDVLISEFVESLKGVDMSNIDSDVVSADVITLSPINESVKSQLISVIKTKLNREITINALTDENLGGGVLLKFGSMALDGSIKNSLRERAIQFKEELEATRV